MARGTLAGAFRVRFVTVLALMYVGVVLLVTLWPTTVDRGLDPYIERFLQELHERGVPRFIDYGFVEFAANIVFFVPVGFLGGLLLPLRFSWLAVIAGGLFSAAIETTQLLLLPGRVASLADVVANTSGALIGFLVALAVRLLILHRDVLVIRDVLEGRRASDGLPVRH
ncbi:VanZ family protein [Amnibacterium endophyticum]|uniref:VanZ family protein n=1 Tax=Amnibacterium endophyticum TaxID=2109337 RepID=A0ABW4LEL9_9MICO